MNEWLRKILSKVTAASPPQREAPAERTVDLLGAVERDAIIARHLSQHLPQLGLTQVTPRSWVDGSAPPARRMFQLALLKGAGMTPNWGFSLDFVPHISGPNMQISARSLRWHRSDKTAMLDVIVDPRDVRQFSFLFGADALDRELEEHLPASIVKAQETWRRGSTWRGMLAIVEEIREPKTNRFGFYNYTQLPLAFAFLSAKVGDLAAAEAELEALREQQGDAIAEKLINLAREMAAADL